MKFHKYDDTYSVTKRCMKVMNIKCDLSTTKVYDAAVDSSDDPLEVLALRSEAVWWREGRPYYNVYPSMLDVLSQIDLGRLPFSVFKPHKERFIAIQLPCGYVDDIAAILFGFYEHDYSYGSVVSVRIQHTKCDPLHGVNTPDTTDMILGCPDDAVDKPISEASMKGEWNDKTAWARNVAYSIMLMEHDPDFFEPHILTADQTKFDNAKSEEHRQALIEKAVKRRGQRGYVIGRQMETIPHFRRPHPALRWTGKGRKVPKIVMVKGSIVHRSKFTQVPTGRYGNEVEA